MTVDLNRFDAFVRALDLNSGKGKVAREVLRVANRIDTKINREAFRTKGKSIGPEYEPNKPIWAAFKKKTTGSKRPLVFRGRLKSSLTKMNDADRVAELKHYAITLGTRVPYAGKHRQEHTAPRFVEREAGWTFDSKRPWRIPARDFLGRRREQLEGMSEELSRIAKEEMLKAFRSARVGPLGSDPHGLLVVNGADVRAFLKERSRPRGTSPRNRSGLR